MREYEGGLPIFPEEIAAAAGRRACAGVFLASGKD